MSFGRERREGSKDAARRMGPLMSRPRAARCVRMASTKKAPGSTTGLLSRSVGRVAGPVMVKMLTLGARSIVGGKLPLGISSLLIRTPWVGGTTSSLAGGMTLMSMQLSLKFRPETGAAYQSIRNDLFQMGWTH